MRSMMEVVVPFPGVEPGPPIRVALVQAGDVAIVLGGQMHMAIREAGARTSAASSSRIVGSERVVDLVDRIEPQPVEAILIEPEERVLDEEIAHRIAAHRRWRAPQGVCALGWKKSGA